MPRLTPKQQRFAIEYLRLGQGKAAAIAAGYSPNTAAQIAHILLKKPHVRALIEKETRDAADRARSNADWVIERLEREAENMENSGGERIRALELLGRIHGMFVERKEVRHTHEADFFAKVDLSEDAIEGDFEELPMIEQSNQEEDEKPNGSITG